MLPFSMDFNLSPSQLAAETAARALGDELPAIIDAADVIRAAARHRLLDVTHDLLGTAVIVETVAHASAAAGIALALHISVLRSIGDHPAVDALASGEDVGALALSSDEQPTGGPQLSGRASWVAPLTPKGLAVVGAGTNGELVAYAVRLEAGGVTMEPIETPALAGITWGHLSFQSTRALAIGPTPPVMSRARILLAAAALGMGRRALLEALHVARSLNRTGAGGEQTVQGLLADAATELEAARLLTWKAAATPNEPTLGAASLAKLAATEATQRAVLRATQVVGGESFRKEHIIDRLARDVRALELFAGRTEALREAAAAEIL